MDDEGRLVEDWGTIEIKLAGEGLTPADPPQVRPVKLDGVVPAAQALSRHGTLALTLTAYRAPIFPAGVDVLTVRIEQTADRQQQCHLALSLPDNVRIGATSVAHGGRMVVALPPNARFAQAMRDWGWADDAVPLPGWAKPVGSCDPAFANIRAGLGGVPIHYRFPVTPGSTTAVVLGFCESHWTDSGQRPVVCQVEGNPEQELDPLARWGRHKPGAVQFAGRDQNSDGWLDVAVLPCPGAPDRNPILNVIWLFPAGQNLDLNEVVTGKLNASALRHVDVGGAGDQSLYAGGKVEYALSLQGKGVEELNFLVACPGGEAPLPSRSTWTAARLRAAAVEVWRDWPEK